MATVGQAVFELLVNDAQFRAQLQRAGRDFSTFIGGARSALGALGLVAGGAGLVGLVKQALDTGSAIQDMATRTGLGVEALQELQFAAQQTGVGVGDLETAMRRLAVNLADAARGNTAESVELFQRLGISATNSAGGLKTVDGALGEIADAIARIKDPTEQADLAIKAFGRSGTQLLPLLKEGRAGIAAMGEEARRLGAVLDADTVRATEAAGDELDKMATLLKADLVRSVAAVLPALMEMRDIFLGIRDAVKAITSIGKPDEALGLPELTQRLEDAQRRLEGLKSSATQLRLMPGGGFMAPPRGAGDPDLIRQQEAEVAKLQRLIEERRPKAPNAVLSVSGSGMGLTDRQKADIIKGWVDAAEAAIQEYENELKALERIHDERLQDEQKMFDAHNAGVIASIEAEIDEYESGLREIARLRDEQVAREERQLEEHNAGVVAAIEAEIAAYEDGLRELARIQDERDRPFKNLQDATHQARVEAEAFGETIDQVRVRYDALREAMRALIGQGRENTEEFAKLKAEMQDLKPLIAVGDLVTTVFSSIDNAISTSLQGVLLGTQSVEDAFRNMGQNIGLSLVQSGIRQALDVLKDLLIEFLQSEAVKGFVKFLVNLGVSAFSGAAGSSAGTGTATVPAGANGIVAMAHGGVVTRPQLALIGEAGPEAVVPLDKLGGSHMEVNVYAPPGSQVEQRERRGPDNRMIRDIVIKMVDDELSRGGFDQTLKATHGLTRRGVAR